MFTFTDLTIPVEIQGYFVAVIYTLCVGNHLSYLDSHGYNIIQWLLVCLHLSYTSHRINCICIQYWPHNPLKLRVNQTPTFTSWIVTLYIRCGIFHVPVSCEDLFTLLTAGLSYRYYCHVNVECTTVVLQGHRFKNFVFVYAQSHQIYNQTLI
jgi:hypothetical protein